jgi:hypothetical protein
LSGYLVSPTGDDSTGDGSYSAPFKTIAHAATVAASTPVDVIEVSGTVVETVPIVDTSGFKLLRGQGVEVSGVAVDLAGAWMSFDSADAPSLLIVGLRIDALAAATLFAGAATDDTTGNVTAARCRLSLIEDSVAVALSGPDPQTFLPSLTMDLLHCVVEGPEGARAGAAFSNVGSPAHASAARNCIFRRLRAANAEGTQPFDSDANLYFDNERDITLGNYGRRDLRSVDPLLIGSTVNPLLGSPVENAGADLSKGYGLPVRTVSEEIVTAFDGESPTIGIVEAVTVGARTFVTTTDIHTILMSFAQEAQKRRDDLAQIEHDRSPIAASGSELSRRLGTLYGIPFSGTDVETYRTILEEISTAVLQGAPTWHVLRRIAQVLFPRTVLQASPMIVGNQLLRRDFNRNYHFKVGSKLKLWADASGGLPTYTFYLAAGEIQIEDRWYPVRRAPFTVAAADAVWTVYAGTVSPADVNGEIVVIISDDPVPDESLVPLGGLYTFRRGETSVETTVDIDEIAVQRHRRIATGFFSSDYVVESVDDARHLTLRYPFPEEDHVGLAYVVVPNFIFGRVTVTAVDGVVRIDCPGRVGRSLRPRSHDGKGFGYALTLDADGTALVAAASEVVALFDVLGRAHPVHKLGFFKLRDDFASLILAQPWPFGSQSSADYIEQFDDLAWSTA